VLEVRDPVVHQLFFRLAKSEEWVQEPSARRDHSGDSMANDPPTSSISAVLSRKRRVLREGNSQVGIELHNPAISILRPATHMLVLCSAN